MPEQLTVRPHLLESWVSHRYGWQSKNSFHTKAFPRIVYLNRSWCCTFIQAVNLTGLYHPHLYMCISLGMDGLNIYIYTHAHTRAQIFSLAFTAL